ncbi:MAG TPA: peptidylprolyl isomerase [Candidatus Cloacimonadota bacterium]|nr:peptidylprolyl isomerase [Candidatus Cloacimonadota bacterium]
MKRVLLLLILAGIFFVSACNKNQDTSAKLAEVNGEVLTLDAFKSTFGVEEWDSLSPETRKRYVEDWVNLTLLAQETRSRGLDKELAMQQRISYATKKVKANALISASLAKLQISEDQLFSYFRIHQAEFLKPVMLYKIERIKLQDKISAENVLQQLNAGMSFAQAVRQHSIEALRNQGGSMGFVAPGSPDSLFWQSANTLQASQYGVLSVEDAWYVIRYTETKDGESDANFEDHRAEIKRRIILERQEEVYQNLLREIKAKQQNIYYY